jgi:uncharacterized protein (DUF433 family)
MTTAVKAAKAAAKRNRPSSFALQSKVLANDENMLWGQTTFRGTRVLAATLFEYLANGQTVDDFLEDFPMERELAVTLLQEIGTMLTP